MKKKTGGRDGKIIFRRRGRRKLVNRCPNLVFSGRRRAVSFLVNFYPSYVSRRIFGVFVFTNGFASLSPISENFILFQLNRPACASPAVHREFVPIFQTLWHITKRAHVSFLTQHPLLTSSWIRSSGSKGLLFLKDKWVKLVLIRMPSKQFKYFPSRGLGLDFPIWGLPRRFAPITKCGFHVALGHKPNVRGVARNPVDHPHGGRTKTIASPRSPWGWIAKRK